MDFHPVYTHLESDLSPYTVGAGTLLLPKASRRSAAWSIATSGVRLVSDFRGAPGMGARAAGRAFHRLCHAVCRSNRVRVHIDSGLPQEPCILVANHQSYLDPVIVGSLVPCLPIAKVEVAQWPFVGELAQRYGALFVKQGSAGSSYRVLRHALAHLREGGTILNFPEGATNERRVARFRKGIFGLAELARVPVVPVAVAMTPYLVRRSDQSAVAHYLTVVREAPHDVFVRVGQPLPNGRDASLLARLARARIQVMLEELRRANGLVLDHGDTLGSSFKQSARHRG